MAVTLQELIEDQKWNGMNDLQIIKNFFVMNDMEEEAIKMISELSEEKVNKLKHKLRIAKEWTAYLPSKCLYEDYDLDTADMLHSLELYFLTNDCKLAGSYLKWAKENIPNIKLPKAYFRPLIEWMDDEGIRFKGEEPLKDKFYLKDV